MADKPNFALMIGKKLDAKDGTEPPDTLPGDDSAPPPIAGEKDEAGSMQDSAVADLMAAFKSSNIPAAKQALKDLIQLLDTEEPNEEV